jgi:hypothetical protein
MKFRYLVLAVSWCISAAPASGSAPTVAFETISLKHLTACEIGPLLGSPFRYAAALAEPVSAEEPLPSKEFPGVNLITAAHPMSRYLLAAGTAEGVGELRGFVERFDAARRRVRISATVYPCAPAQMTGWTRLAAVTGVEAVARTVPAGEELRFPALPPDFKSHEIVTDGYRQVPELIPLPLFSGWPQVLLSVAADVEEKRQMLVGMGVLDEETRPAGALRQAWELRNTLRLGSGESLALWLSREDSAITVVLTPSATAGSP